MFNRMKRIFIGQPKNQIIVLDSPPIQPPVVVPDQKINSDDLLAARKTLRYLVEYKEQVRIKNLSKQERLAKMDEKITSMKVGHVNTDQLEIARKELSQAMDMEIKKIKANLAESFKPLFEMLESFVGTNKNMEQIIEGWGYLLDDMRIEKYAQLVANDAYPRDMASALVELKLQGNLNDDVINLFVNQPCKMELIKAFTDLHSKKPNDYLINEFKNDDVSTAKVINYQVAQYKNNTKALVATLTKRLPTGTQKKEKLQQIWQQIEATSFADLESVKAKVNEIKVVAGDHRNNKGFYRFFNSLFRIPTTSLKIIKETLDENNNFRKT